jgi:energy-coupling factor transporter ATP-binding protein EcfA2
MEIIVLEGNDGSGKTAALGMLYAILANTPGTTIINHPSAITGVRKDFQVLLEYPTKSRKLKKVAIYTDGDYTYHITNAVAHYAPLADILVIPVRPGMLLSALFPSPPHAIRAKITKTTIALAPKSSALFAEHLVANVKDALTIQSYL